MVVRHCTRCDLRFQAEAELKDHLLTDHGVQPEILQPFSYATAHAETVPATPPGRDVEPTAARKRYLLVANQTLGGDAVMDAVRECLEAGPCHFHVLVPATKAADYPAGLTTVGAGVRTAPEPGSDREAMAQARRRVRTQLDRLRELGASADGEIGDPDPLAAIRSALGREPVDGIILSTLPPGMSRWLRRDLPSRVERAFDVPVTVITS